ncbi:MAG: hypothetical protein HY269_07070 [Deltaproteobacteria bacterium]|nr:hypothetical protein [Deltaproteobacteria bacterium]
MKTDWRGKSREIYRYTCTSDFQADEAQNKGATHFHFHASEHQQIRQMEVRDLLAQHTEAYEPSGCNKRR